MSLSPTRTIWISGLILGLGTMLGMPRITKAQATPAPDLRPQAPQVLAEKCLVKTWSLNALVPELDGQWLGIILANDGKIYFGSSTHSGERGGALFRFDPTTEKLDQLVDDITKVCGEDPKVNPQGKLHSDFIQHDGWIYFTTHFSSEKKGAAEIYTGYHLLGYHPATGSFRDMGRPHPGYTSYTGIQVDPIRHRLYVLGVPLTKQQAQQKDGGTKVAVIDIATGQIIKQIGPINNKIHDNSFSFFVDRRGDLWFNLRSDPTELLQIKAQDLSLHRHRAKYPGYGVWDRVWALPGGEQALTAQLDGKLYLFDPAQTPGSEEMFKAVANPGPIHLGAILAGDLVYYVQRAGRQSEKQGTRDRHLLATTFGSSPVIYDYGLIVDQDGRNPWRIHYMTADLKGNVYMVGDWHVNSDEKGSRRYHQDRTTGDAAYRFLPRGQFFGVVKLPIPGTVADQQP